MTVKRPQSQAARFAFVLTVARPTHSPDTLSRSAAAFSGQRGQNVGQDWILYQSAALLLRA